MTGSCRSTGSPTALRWYYEKEFNPATVENNEFGTPKMFGKNQQITTLAIRNNPEHLYGYGTRSVVDVVPKQFEGALGVEWTLSNPYIFYALLGEAPEPSSFENVIKTFTFNQGFCVKSMQMDLGLKLREKDVDLSIYGICVNSLSLNANVNEIVNCSLDGLFRDYAKAVVTEESDITPAEEGVGFAPYVFHHGSVVCSDVEEGTVQTFSLDISNNLLMQYGVGDRHPQNVVPQQLDITASLDTTFDDIEFLDIVKTMGKQTSITLTFNNGKSGEDEREIEITLEDIWYEEFNPTIQYNVPLTHNIPIRVGKITVVSKDMDDPDEVYGLTAPPPE